MSNILDIIYLTHKAKSRYLWLAVTGLALLSCIAVAARYQIVGVDGIVFGASSGRVGVAKDVSIRHSSVNDQSGSTRLNRSDTFGSSGKAKIGNICFLFWRKYPMTPDSAGAIGRRPASIPDHGDTEFLGLVQSGAFSIIPHGHLDRIERSWLQWLHKYKVPDDNPRPLIRFQRGSRGGDVVYGNSDTRYNANQSDSRRDSSDPVELASKLRLPMAAILLIGVSLVILGGWLNIYWERSRNFQGLDYALRASWLLTFGGTAISVASAVGLVASLIPLLGHTV